MKDGSQSKQVQNDNVLPTLYHFFVLQPGRPYGSNFQGIGATHVA